MTTMTTTQATAGIGFDRDVVSRVAAVVAALIFATAGLVLIAMGMAFPIAVSVVEQQALRVDPADLAFASRLGGVWYLFIGASAANFAAALAILDRGALAKRIAIVVSGTTLALVLAAGIGIALDGSNQAAQSVIGGLSAAFAVALAASIAVKRS